MVVQVTQNTKYYFHAIKEENKRLDLFSLDIFQIGTKFYKKKKTG